VEGLHEVDAVAVASRGSHPTRAKALNTTPMDVTASIRSARPKSSLCPATLIAPPNTWHSFRPDAGMSLRHVAAYDSGDVTIEFAAGRVISS
jgi:hypothetical protein